MKLLRSAILVVTAAAAALVPTAALADGYGHSDATGDVQSVVIDAAGNVTDQTATPEPTAKLGDITRIRATNTSRSVKVVVHFADLQPTGSGQVHEVLIATRSNVRVAFVGAGPGLWGGKATLRTLHNKKVRCSVGHHIDYAYNKVVVKVPASCLGHPKVIKVGAVTFVGDTGKVYYDDGYATGGAFASLFALSPKIHR